MRSEEKSAAARSDFKTESTSNKTDQMQTESAVHSGVSENAQENAATEGESEDEIYDEGDVAEEESNSYVTEFSDSRSKDQVYRIHFKQKKGNALWLEVQCVIL